MSEHRSAPLLNLADLNLTDVSSADGGDAGSLETIAFDGTAIASTSVVPGRSCCGGIAGCSQGPPRCGGNCSCVGFCH